MAEHLRFLRQNQEGIRIACDVLRLQIGSGIPVQRKIEAKEETYGKSRIIHKH